MKKIVTFITIVIVLTISAIGNSDGNKKEHKISGNEKAFATTPFFCGFDTQDSFDSWNMINANNDIYAWYRVKETWNDNYFASYKNNPDKDANDWIISPTIRLYSDKNYVIRYLARNYSLDTPEKLKLTMGKGREIEDQTMILQDLSIKIGSVFQEQVKRFTVDETGDYNFGVQCYSKKTTFGRVDIDDFIVEEDRENDLEAITVQIPIMPSVGKSYTCYILVKNNGRIAQRNYKVQLVDANDRVLASRDVVDHYIGPTYDDVLTIDWTPTAAEDIKVYGKVIVDYDNNHGNDQTSDYMFAKVQPADAAEWTSIGSKTGGTEVQPFDFKSKMSTTQSLYTKGELNSPNGKIEKILYFYHVFNDEIKDKQIKVYMSNTDKTSLNENWIGKEEMKMVYSGAISLNKDGKYVIISLDTPFLYTGGNLCIMTERVMDSNSNPNFTGVFAATSNAQTNGRNRTYSSNDKVFDFSQIGVTNNTLTDVMIAIQSKFGGIITGSVKDINDAILANARVEISGAEWVIVNEDGVYTFGYAPVGNYAIVAKSLGYEDKSVGVSVVAGETTITNIKMIKRSTYKVMGKVTDLDGIPLASVNVKLRGYDTMETITNEQGQYRFNAVYTSDNYTLVASRAGFYQTIKEFIVGNTDVIIEDVKLQDILLPPSEVRATLVDEVLTVSWGLPSVKEFRYDADNVRTGVGLITGTTKSVFGTAYKEPALLDEMSWFTTDQGDPRHTVTVYVFSLNSNGAPTKNILFMQENVPNVDNQWNKFIFPQQISAPNGFMLAIAYNGFVALAVDSGDDPTYPFLWNTHFFSRDYTTGSFTTLENGGAFGNCLIRAKGILNYNSPTKINTPKALLGYNVWRFLEGQEGEQSKWIKLTAVPTTSMSVIDTQWNTLSDGNYCYVTNTVYPGNRTSGASYSNYIPKNMFTKLIVNAKTNTSTNEINGAKVTLTNADNKPTHVYKSTFDATGRIEIKDVWKGMYEIKIERDRYTTVEQSLDLSTLNSYSTPMYTLKEIQEQPFNLQIVETGVESERILRWNDTPNINETFERHDDFAINSAGSYDWSYIDGDKGYTSTITGTDFPGQTSPMAYIVFNPNTCVPPLPNYPSPSAPPHSGEKFLASIVSLNNVKNDDWIISPKLNFYKNFQLKFFAKSYYALRGPEEIMVGYSTTTADKDSFIWLTEPVIKVPEKEWTEYSFDLPKEAKYVTIRNVSFNKYILMIDDIFIGYERTREFVKYRVYLDGNMVEETTDIEYKFANLTNGKHVAGVEAFYTSGTSKMNTKTFYVGVPSPTTDLTINVITDNVKISAEGAIITLSNVNSSVSDIFTTTVDASGQATIKELTKGIYNISIEHQNCDTFTESNVDLSQEDEYNLGVYTLHVTVGINDINSGVKIYPNPVSEATNYKLHITGMEVHSCELFDFAGRLITSHGLQITTNGAIVNMKSLTSGVYILHIKTVAGREINQKIIRQ